MQTFILTLSCPDATGIVAAVSQIIAKHQGTIIEASQHTETSHAQFFMRVEIGGENFSYADTFKQQFSSIAEQFRMQWQLRHTANKKRLALLVSKHDHCLADLLYRWRSQELDCEIPFVISNHSDLKDYVEWHNIPYHHIAIDATDRASGFKKIEQTLNENNIDGIILARFMQIMPPEICAAYHGRMINIHHSFLPSFIGARPYQQAFERGVKLIGATCHYVTAELDAGPIIEQDVIRIDHSHAEADLVRLGRDVEKRVLAQGVRLFLQDRIMLHDNKTIIFA